MPRSSRTRGSSSAVPLLLALVACAGEPPATASAPPSGPDRSSVATSVAEGPVDAPPLLLLRPAGTVGPARVRPLRHVPLRGPAAPGAAADAPDPPRDEPGLRAPVPITATFPGIGVGLGSYAPSAAPPDTIGAIGPAHYVQAVNASMAIFGRTGALLLGPVELNSLFAGLGGPCAANNDGDPSVLYDQAADRWVVSQFSVTGRSASTGYYQCVAVSRTPDPTGAWWLYAFRYSAFNDYPKLSVWPDAYHATYVMFSDANAYLGPTVCALDRARMLEGLPATQQCVDLSSAYGPVLVSSQTGPVPPPAGSPAYLLSLGPVDGRLTFWKLQVDWAVPAQTTLSPPVPLVTSPFALPCGGTGGPCVTQPGTTQTLDTLGDRLMQPLAYRNLGDHEALVVTHTIAAGGTAGVRWYEVRNPAATPEIFQQGTVAPDAAYRFMGSASMDRAGNVALGYSVSSSALSVKPSIAVSGRLASDAPGTLPLGETLLFAGNGVQTSGLERWGDYSSMTVDPVDDCTFYYANQYQPANGAFNWSTRVGYFTFPGCLPPPDFGLSASPGTLTLAPGSSGSSAIATVQVGSPGTVGLTATVSPAGFGVVASVSPASVAAGGGATLEVTAADGATPGAYTITVTGSEGASTHATSVAVTVIAAADFALSAAPVALTVTQGTSGASAVSTVQVGSPGTVALAASVAPAGSGVTASLSPASVAAGGGATLTVAAAATATAGSYTVTVTGAEGSFTHAAQVAVTVIPPADFALSAAPAALTVTQGTSGTSALSTVQVGSPGTVALSASVSPPGTGVTASLSPASVAAGSGATLTVTAAAGAPTGSYAVTVDGAEGSFTHAAAVAVTVVAPADFTLSATPSALSVVQGGSGTATVSTVQVGSPGSVALSASVSPAGTGVTALLGASSVASGASTSLTVSATSGAAPGTYAVAITGTEGAFTRTQGVTVAVSAPEPASGGGCSSTGNGGASLLPLVPLLALLLPRRRRPGTPGAR